MGSTLPSRFGPLVGSAILFLATVVPPAISRAEERPQPVSSDYAGLVEQLGSAEFEVRQAAEQALTRAGLDAEAALASGAASEDLEVRTRARRLLHHTSEARLRLTPPGWTLAWSIDRQAQPNFYNLDPWLSSGVLIAEDDKKLVAFDAAVGRKLWETPLFGGLGNAAPLIQACDGGFIFFSQNRCFEFVDARSGEKRWKHDLSFSPQQWFVRSGLVIAGDNRRLVAVSLSDGEFVYDYDVAKQYCPIGCDSERLLSWSNAERKVAVRRLSDGAPIGDFAPMHQPNGVVQLAGDRVVFLDASRKAITAYQIADGLKLWTSPLDVARAPHQTYFWTWFDADSRHIAAPGLLWSAVDGRKLQERPLAAPKVESLRLADQYAGVVRAFPVPPTVSGDVVYYPGLNGQLTAVNVTDQSLRWVWQVGSGQGYRTLIDGDSLIASTEKRIVCLKAISSEPRSPAPVVVAEKPGAGAP